MKESTAEQSIKDILSLNNGFKNYSKELKRNDPYVILGKKYLKLLESNEVKE